MSQALIVGPVVSEFGWELMDWQGYVRARAKNIPRDNIVVCTTRGLEYLYLDFCDRFVPHDIKCDRDGHKPRNGKIDNPEAYEDVIKLLNDFRTTWQSMGRRINWMRSWGKNPTKVRGAQQWHQYGEQEPETTFKVIIHARNRLCGAPFAGDNYPRPEWDRLIERLYMSGIAKEGEIAAVGTSGASFVPAGCIYDARDMPLRWVASVMKAAHLVLGPSSGPMHLASLCRTPHVVWAIDRHQSLIKTNNKVRYETLWNPFRTPVEVLMHRKGDVIPPAEIVRATVKLLKRVYNMEKKW
jgi:hypothetical protein